MTPDLLTLCDLPSLVPDPLGPARGKATRLRLVAALFRAHPGEWLTMQELAAVGGTGGWRTRVSDCRLDLGMAIENRTWRDGAYTISEYRYQPGQAPGQRKVAA